MFNDTHPHLFDIAAPKDSCGDNSLCVLPGPDTPRLGGPTLDKNNRRWPEHSDWVRTLQPRLARLSTRGKQEILLDVGHNIPAERPEAIVKAVREVCAPTAQ